MASQNNKKHDADLLHSIQVIRQQSALRQEARIKLLQLAKSIHTLHTTQKVSPGVKSAFIDLFTTQKIALQKNLDNLSKAPTADAQTQDRAYRELAQCLAKLTPEKEALKATFHKKSNTIPLSAFPKVPTALPTASHTPPPPGAVPSKFSMRDVEKARQADKKTPRLLAPSPSWTRNTLFAKQIQKATEVMKHAEHFMRGFKP